MNISFNELSLKECFIGQNEKNINLQNFEDMLRCIKNLKEQKCLDTMFIFDNVLGLEISNKYSIYDWLNDSSINSNHKQFLRSVFGRAKKFSKSDIENEACFEFEGSELNSLGAAYVKKIHEEETLLSVTSHDCWRSPQLGFKYRILLDNADINEEVIEYLNITIGTDLDTIRKQHRNKSRRLITSGQDLWEQRKELFPNLTFCEGVKYQLFDDSEKNHIEKVINRLERMQEYFEKPHTRYDPHEMGLKARTESDAVKTDKELKELRGFILPSGEKEYFFDHISFCSPKYSSGRIHFLPDVDNKNCYIGYIGAHLKTKKY